MKYERYLRQERSFSQRDLAGAGDKGTANLARSFFSKLL